MKDRILKILSHYGLSSSKLADLLGVQRSGISHILSGRNNPGYDFLVKLLQEFPEINANWLLLEQGSMLNTKSVSDSFNAKEDHMGSPLNTSITEQSGLFENASMNKEVNKPVSESYISKQAVSEGKQIERIVFFFRDGSFRDYEGSHSI